MENAVKYNESNEPMLQVIGESIHGSYRLSISDNGIGMTSDELERCFAKFYRAPKGRKHDVKGFGLGLYFAKSIVEQHGGNIKVSSNVGRGSEFTIEIPYSHAN